jgi:hypothetical protein
MLLSSQFSQDVGSQRRGVTCRVAIVLGPLLPSIQCLRISNGLGDHGIYQVSSTLIHGTRFRPIVLSANDTPGIADVD